MTDNHKLHVSYPHVYLENSLHCSYGKEYTDETRIYLVYAMVDLIIHLTRNCIQYLCYISAR